MAPKPRPIQRKLSSAGKNQSTVNLPKTQNARKMPPPPVPAATAAPQGILMPEAVALASCLKTAAIKTGQVLRFYSDTQRLRIHRHAPYPPRAVTTSLGRELEKYDQLCDAMQSHLNRAVNVLKRDLEREKDRLKAAEEAAAAEATKTVAPTLPTSPVFSPTTEPADPAATSSVSKGSGLTGRRQSTISLSSLQRTAFPHKLDLSSPALRLNPEDLNIPSGLASPVMLAPKTSVPQIAPDFPYGGPGDVTIDLTLDDDVSVGMVATVPPGTDPGLGNSADKPIELLDIDIDMELFGDAGTNGSTSAPAVASNGLNAARSVKEEPTDFGVFSNLAAAPLANEEDARVSAELLASLNATTQISSPSNHPATDQQSASLVDSGVSPGSILADLQAVTNASSSGSQNANDDPANFGLSLEFLKQEGIMSEGIMSLFESTS
ncbi:hypothetical protein BC835DRAFT_1327305 [Cytidiella melzeri]|nr:hypothetical protein BC835DRAFT_1327305 [Cytidiella melzeri]